MGTSSSILAWRIPGTGEPDGLPSVGLHRVGHDWSDLAAAAASYEKAKVIFRILLWTQIQNFDVAFALISQELDRSAQGKGQSFPVRES